MAWATRFAISDPAGATTPPPNATQPGTGDNIAWGIGDLVNPSEAVGAPGASSASSVANVPSSSSIFIASFTTAPFSSTTPIIPVSIQPSPSSQRVATTAVAVSSSTPSITDIGSSSAIALSATSIMISLIIPVFSLMLIWTWYVHLTLSFFSGNLCCGLSKFLLVESRQVLISHRTLLHIYLFWFEALVASSIFYLSRWAGAGALLPPREWKISPTPSSSSDMLSVDTPLTFGPSTS